MVKIPCSKCGEYHTVKPNALTRYGKTLEQYTCRKCVDYAWPMKHDMKIRRKLKELAQLRKIHLETMNEYEHL